jgi:hypothetical protein
MEFCWPHPLQPHHRGRAGSALLAALLESAGVSLQIAGPQDFYRILQKRVVIGDVHASIYRAAGISPKLAYEIEKRPFYVTRDGLGKPIEALFG